MPSGLEEVVVVGLWNQKDEDLNRGSIPLISTQAIVRANPVQAAAALAKGR